MYTVDVCRPGSRAYGEVSAFASAVYMEKIGFHIRNFPQYFLYSTNNDGEIKACIGINTSVDCPLFRNDPRFREYRFENGDYGEQSIFAADGFNPGIVLLAAAMVEYAYHLNIRYLAFAAIEISMKLIERMKVPTFHYGFADKMCLPPELAPDYEKWFAANKPTLEILDTADAPAICDDIYRKLEKRVEFGSLLGEELAAYRAPSGKKAVVAAAA